MIPKEQLLNIYLPIISILLFFILIVLLFKKNKK